jgi:hypothetical protein
MRFAGRLPGYGSKGNIMGLIKYRYFVAFTYYNKTSLMHGNAYMVSKRRMTKDILRGIEKDISKDLSVTAVVITNYIRQGIAWR